MSGKNGAVERADAELPAKDASANSERMVTRSHGLRIRAVREADREADFIASTECIDSYDEIVEQVWDLDRYLGNPVVLFAHDSRSLPIGQCTSVGVRNGNLECTIRFASAEANPMAENVWQSVKEKTLRAVSVGFVPRDVRREMRDGDEVYVLSDNELHEISVVPIPANPEALAKMRARARTAGEPKAESDTYVDKRTFERRASDAQRAQLAAGLVMTLEAIGIDPQSIPELAAPSPSPNDRPATGSTENDMDLKEATEKLEKSEKALIDVRVSEKAATDKALAQEATIRSLEAERTKLATEKAALEAQNTTIAAERDADRAELQTLRTAVIAREVDALVGVKIDPAETELFVELATTNRPLYDKMVAQRTAKVVLGGPVLKPEIAPIEKTATVGGDSGEALANIALKQASAA